MSLLDEIRIAQRDAGKAAVIKNLERQGLIRCAPLSVSPPAIDMDALNKDLVDYRAQIARLRSAIGVLAKLLDTSLEVLETLELEGDDEARDLNVLQEQIKAALQVMV